MKHPDKSSDDIRKTQMGFGALSLSLSQKKQKKLRKCDAKLRKRAPERAREGEYVILFCFVLFCFVLFCFVFSNYYCYYCNELQVWEFSSG